MTTYPSGSGYTLVSQPIGQDLQQMARVPALRLLQRLGAGTSKLPTIGSPQLIIRDSTAPPRRADDRPVA